MPRRGGTFRRLLTQAAFVACVAFLGIGLTLAVAHTRFGEWVGRLFEASHAGWICTAADCALALVFGIVLSLANLARGLRSRSRL